MTCDDVADCIETDEGVQTALRNVFGSSNPFDTHPVGEPLPEDEYQENQLEGTNPTCDLDVLWAQCLSVVQKFNRDIADTLEDIEVTTNVVEIMDALEDLPLVKYVANFFGVSAAIELIEYYQEAVAEQYLAEYDEALENELTCALFCAAGDDCQLSINTMFDVFAARVTAYILEPDLITDLTTLIEIYAGLEFDATAVVDLAFFFCAAGWKVGNFIFSKVADKNFKTLMALAVDNASPDWELLCTECPVRVENVGIYIECATGVRQSRIVSEGAEFTLDSYQNGIFTTTNIVAMRLPAGNWNVTYVSNTGLTEVTASNACYQYFDDTGTLISVTPGGGGSVTTFGTKETTAQTDATICATQPFNVAFFSQTSFNITLTIAAV